MPQLPPGCYVLIGGGLGALARSGLEHLVPDPSGAIPTTTLTINLTGAFALGLLVRVLSHSGPDDGWRRVVRLGVGTGVLGGYTTFSAFAVQNVVLMEQGRLLAAASYVVLSVAGGASAAWAGTALGNRMARQR